MKAVPKGKQRDMIIYFCQRLGQHHRNNHIMVDEMWMTVDEMGHVVKIKYNNSEVFIKDINNLN